MLDRTGCCRNGANARLTMEDVAACEDIIRSADVVVCQLETPVETVDTALTLAKAANVRTVLNPAPARSLSDRTLSLVSVLTPNETEAVLLAENPDHTPKSAAIELCRRGVESVVVTLGAAGAFIRSGNTSHVVAGRSMDNVVDTTAAGDCFTGALAVALGEGRSLREAVEFANAAAALSVTREGAQPSLPYRTEIASS